MEQKMLEEDNDEDKNDANKGDSESHHSLEINFKEEVIILFQS